MYELIQLSENDYYIDCPAKIGIVKINENNDVVLIDSGNDKDAGKKALKILQANNWKLQAIFNTHSHADHIGGNKFLQEKTNCSIYANGMECTYSNTPILEPIGLYGGMPFKEAKNKFLMAQTSNVLPLTQDILPEGFEIIKLPGHSFDMVGFITKDGTAFIADSVSSEETLAKYGIGYLWNPDEALNTLNFIQDINASLFVPSHAPVTQEIKTLANANIQAIISVKNSILKFCDSPISFETLLKNIFDEYNLQMTAQQYLLIGSTVRCYLSALYDSGQLTFGFNNNEMIWNTNKILKDE